MLCTNTNITVEADFVVNDGDGRTLLCNRVGLPKGYKLKLNIDTFVKPVAQPIRRIPFGVREKVEKKLDELLACGIIEEVPEGPTSWVSSLVVAPKPDGDVTICIDMRHANQAIIIRERQPIPTVKEVLQDLNGSTVFSCADLMWRFHQILLAEESNHVTLFVTHCSLFHVWGDLSIRKKLHVSTNHLGCIAWL